MTTSPTSFARPTVGAAALAILLLSGSSDLVAQGTLSADDHAAITQLYARYNHAIDLGDAQGWAAAFVEDGTFGRTRGRAALVAFAANWYERYEGYSRHWAGEIVLTPTAGGATGAAYLVLWDMRTSPPSIVLTGIYADQLVRTPHGWRFQSRVLTIDRPESDGN
jgi:hypothetical protein